tara:strand:+ start:813 stop:962 length:150 start_codon:yes stop_codon:yes gene_type:complete
MKPRAMKMKRGGKKMMGGGMAKKPMAMKRGGKPVKMSRGSKMKRGGKKK